MKKINPVNLANPVYFPRSLHIALLCPETTKRRRATYRRLSNLRRIRN